MASPAPWAHGGYLSPGQSSSLTYHWLAGSRCGWPPGLSMYPSIAACCGMRSTLSSTGPTCTYESSSTCGMRAGVGGWVDEGVGRWMGPWLIRLGGQTVCSSAGWGAHLKQVRHAALQRGCAAHLQRLMRDVVVVLQHVRQNYQVAARHSFSPQLAESGLLPWLGREEQDPLQPARQSGTCNTSAYRS